MRFSIRSKGIKVEAEVGGTTILIRKRMWPLRLSSGQWHWTWLDGTQMALAYNQQSYRDVRHELFADGKSHVAGQGSCSARVQFALGGS